MPNALNTEEIQTVLDDIVTQMAGETDRGEVAGYIPELEQVPLNRFGIAFAPLNGEPIIAGDAEVPFSIQSISKVFALVVALGHVGATLWRRVGREPSGDPFNSIVQLEFERGKPRNPFINPGAIVVSDVILEHQSNELGLHPVVELCQRLADAPDIAVDEHVFASEVATGDRNRALAYFMLAEGNLRGDVTEVTESYFRQCSIEMSCRQLAMATRFLATGGKGPDAETAGVTPERVRRLNALMMTCGCYDASGEVAFRIGLPCKSGVGGGVVAIAPGVGSIVAWSPGLDEKGNSVLALKALEELAHRLGWSVFQT
ncbi:MULTISPECIES: glutaminase [unclassified Ruegeria]|uniref:glutaminase n=1 Tax=unclassified Ruegeria TaxID=2625375 RepID=UPI001ADB2A7D|nr:MULTISPECIES: glutaminase [unclassified Ruegeria]MBO9410978.1 glutaminase [Ruegeria sp. R8_1]MBO9415179.1 glutaminase [Ruegeria sp. R8_2]